MKRIPIIDSLRGIAIIVMLVFHSSYYWNSSLTVDDYNARLKNPLSMIVFTLGKFAGIFAIISAMVYTLSAYSRKSKGQTTKSIRNRTIISGLWVVLLGKIHAVFFNHTKRGDLVNPYPDGPRYYSMIIGFLQTGKIQMPSMYLLLHRNNALFMIGLSIVITGIILGILFMNDGHTKHKRNLTITAVIGTSIILTTQVLKDMLRPLWVEAVLSDSVLAAVFLGILIGDSFPFFPFAGYALYGIIFGHLFYHNYSTSKVNLLGLLCSATYLSLGIFLYTKSGYPDIRTIIQTPNIQLNFIQIGIMILIFLLVFNIHNLNSKARIKRLLLNDHIRRFGVMTLSIFMFEALLGTLLKIFVLDMLFPQWSNSLFLASCFGISLVFIWSVILKRWEQYNFVGSWEWINARAISYLTGTTTARKTIVENLKSH